MTEKWRLSFDFGTAYSKAWATRGAIEVEVEIALGRASGSDDATEMWTVPTEIWCESRKLYWGVVAARRRQEAGRPERKPLKQRLLEDDGYEGIDKETGLTWRETTTLWLAYMHKLAEPALDGREAWRVARRVAMPCWKSGAGEKARRRLEEGLNQAGQINRWHRGKWNGMKVERAQQLVARSAEEQRGRSTNGKIRGGEIRVVQEPLAAGAGLFEEVVEEWMATVTVPVGPDGIRPLLLVVDAGAGTTDSVLLQAFADDEKAEFGQIRGTQTGVNFGGRAFRSVIEKVLSAEEDWRKSSEAEIEEKAEVLCRRLWNTSVANGNEKEIREKIESTREYREVVEAITNSVSKALTLALSVPNVQRHARNMNIRGEYWPIWTVTTGGAGEMRPVQGITRRRIVIGEATFELRPVEKEATPEWMQKRGLTVEARRGLEIVGRQLAVAIGGARESLSEEIPDLPQVIV